MSYAFFEVFPPLQPQASGCLLFSFGIVTFRTVEEKRKFCVVQIVKPAVFW